MAPAFSTNMVLQAGNPKAAIYGNANATAPGDTVTVTVTPAAAVGGGPFVATAAADGSWEVTLGSMSASLDPITVTAVSKGSGTKQLISNVLRGDVYVCSGQSNMALPVNSGYLPLTPELVEAQALKYPQIRILNNGHFWPPTPSHPGGTALGKQTGDLPGWQLPSGGNGSTASPGTVANFSAACWFMGTTLADHAKGANPIGLISTDAGGTNINRWVSQAASAKCSQVTPTSPQSQDNGSIATLFDPMVRPLAKMALSGFTWYQGEANECPHALPVRDSGPCGGQYYACQLRALIDDWRLQFVNSPTDVPFLVNELGALQDPEWPVLRQSMHQAVAGLPNTHVVANSDMGTTGGRTSHGLPSGAMHSARKVNLGRRNGLAMLALRGASLAGFAASGATGPVLQSATIAKQGAAGYKVVIEFNKSTGDNLHFAGAAECKICCTTKNGSAVQLRIENASAPGGYTWARSEVPTVTGSTVTAIFVPESATAVVATDTLRFMYEGEPECVLYNGVGGPDNGTAIAASPFYVSLAATGQPALVPATPCATMLQNGSCYFEPEPCTGFSNVTCPKDRCCWSPTINNGQCLDKGAPCYRGQCCDAGLSWNLDGRFF